MDLRKSVLELIKDQNNIVDIVLINVPSKWTEYKPGIFSTPSINLDIASNNSNKLLGDQDHEPNHGLLSICSFLRYNNIKFHLIDLHSLAYLNHKSIININLDDYLCSSLKELKPQIIGLSCMTPSLPKAKNIAKLIKSSIDRPITIILGGLASIDIVDCLEDNYIDIVVKGEGERTFLKLIQSLLKGRSIEKINGIAFKKNNEIVSTSVESLQGPLNLLPAYDLLPLELELIPRVFTSRGCSNKCGFCSPSAFFNHSVYIRDSTNVLNEIDTLHEKFEFDWFLIGDLTLFLKNENVRDTLQELARRTCKPWWCQTQVAQLDEKSIDLLHNAKCVQVAVGFEDFSRTNKEIVKKNLSKKDAIRLCRSLRDRGILVQAYWMFGLPEDTLELSLNRISHMCQFIREDLVNTVHISFLIPYSNIPFRKDITLDHSNFSAYLNTECSFYNQLPMHHTKHLNSGEIFLTMQLAISSCANEFWKAKEKNI